MTACRIVALPERKDARGCLAFAQVGDQLPFTARRIFQLYNLHVGIARGGHAHRQCHQFIMAMAGSFQISTSDLHGLVEWQLASPACGLYVPPMQWVDLTPTAPGSVLVVLASLEYDENDYIRDRAIFESYANSSAI